MGFTKKQAAMMLGAVAFAVLGGSAKVILDSVHFGDQFAAISNPPPKNDKVASLDKTPVEGARARLLKPSQWDVAEEGSSLFVAKTHFIDPVANRPRRPEDGKGMVHPPVPDKWILGNKLNLLSKSVLDEDPDKDGFNNLEEYFGLTGKTADPGAPVESTNPNDANSHPPYRTKLFLKQFVTRAFLSLFKAYNGDLKKPEELDFQINSYEKGAQNQARVGTQFLKIGAVVGNTPYRIEKFDYKTAKNAKTGGDDDVSELTLRNIETQEPVVLILNKVTESPDSFAVLTFRLAQPGQELRVQRMKDFTLPGTEESYKLIDITKDRALIRRPSGEEYEIRSAAK